MASRQEKEAKARIRKERAETFRIERQGKSPRGRTQKHLREGDVLQGGDRRIKKLSLGRRRTNRIPRPHEFSS